ncbi:hypothetical protein KY285_020949 [Solanum tuberosum]|uniref:Uncharacterized protein n=1 Tax=Solanum tuberosum TaxID=4113 RepID=M1B7V3_SOLTU|nr:hypothetical protein KY285_020949 [Solanum tuberosum]
MNMEQIQITIGVSPDLDGEAHGGSLLSTPMRTDEVVVRKLRARRLRSCCWVSLPKELVVGDSADEIRRRWRFLVGVLLGCCGSGVSLGSFTLPGATMRKGLSGC